MSDDKNIEMNQPLLKKDFLNHVGGSFNPLKSDVEVLKWDVKVLKKDVEVLKWDVKVLKKDVKVLKEDVRVLKEDVRVLKLDVKELKEDVRVLKEDVKGLKQDVKDLKKDFHKMAILMEENRSQLKFIAELLVNHVKKEDKLEKRVSHLESEQEYIKLVIKNN